MKENRKYYILLGVCVLVTIGVLYLFYKKKEVDGVQTTGTTIANAVAGIDSQGNNVVRVR